MTAIGAEQLDLLVAKLLIVTVEFTFALRTGYPEDFCHGASEKFFNFSEKSFLQAAQKDPEARRAKIDEQRRTSATLMQGD
jgi:hypothetical protein